MLAINPNHIQARDMIKNLHDVRQKKKKNREKKKRKNREEKKEYSQTRDGKQKKYVKNMFTRET